MRDIQAMRRLAIEYLNVATDGAHGRAEHSPIYRLITEGRDWGSGYSSCGDLCHWLLYRLGVRASWINRQEHQGWQTGKNVSRLAWSGPARSPIEGEIYQAGDILMVWNKDDGTDAHVLVVRAHGGEHVYSSDYGQPGGAQRTRRLVDGVLGDRKIQRVLPLADVLASCEQDGLRVEPQLVSDWLMKGSEEWRCQELASAPTLRRGMVGDEVRKAQELLGGLVNDGDFGPKTEARVKWFQKDKGLDADGVIGPNTWGQLL